MPTFASPLEHLDKVLELVATIVERQILVAWETGRLLRPDINDTRSATDMLFARGLMPTPTGTERLGQLDAQLAAIEAELADRTSPELPLVRLRDAFELSPSEERVLQFAIAAEMSVPTRNLLRYFANDVRRGVLDRTGLEALVYGRAGRARLVEEVGPTGMLLERKLLESIPGEESMMFQTLRAAPRVIELATGIVRLAAELERSVEHIPEPTGFDEIVVDDERKEELTGLLGQTSLFGATPIVVLSGPVGAGRRTLLGAAARAHGKGLLRVRTPDLPRDPAAFESAIRAVLREATLLDAMPVLLDVDRLVDAETGDRNRERALETALVSWRKPLAATARAHQAQPIKLGRGSIVVDVPPMSEASRAELWRRELGAHGGDSIDTVQLAARYAVTPGMLVHASRSARTVAAARDGRVTPADVQIGLRGAMDEAVSSLGQRVTKAPKWEDLIGPKETMDALQELVARIKHRRRVFDEWGFADKFTKGLGLSALFTGPPGTGKTMAATLVADKLALDIYQVDVSRIVSKFIGETEKNLAQVFDAAESGHAIILFDEADSLFAQRGEVKSSVDRYANLEVNYLLQRLERFTGITILTTNLASSIDPAFKRRMSFTVEFPMPEAKERERIWRTHLPTRACVDVADTDFKWLADRHEMSGGHIRNAVLRAAFLAASEERTIAFEHLKRAGEIEAHAMGRVL
ncbi:MAG TPA: ATP-binding protein [Kofleriaceae bacterium]